MGSELLLPVGFDVSSGSVGVKLCSSLCYSRSSLALSEIVMQLRSFT